MRVSRDSEEATQQLMSKIAVYAKRCKGMSEVPKEIMVKIRAALRGS